MPESTASVLTGCLVADGGRAQHRWRAAARILFWCCSGHYRAPPRVDKIHPFCVEARIGNHLLQRPISLFPTSGTGAVHAAVLRLPVIYSTDIAVTPSPYHLVRRRTGLQLLQHR